MKNTIRGFFFISLLAVILSGCDQKGLISPNPAITNISVGDGYKLYLNNLTNSSFIVVDVRKPDEYSLGHIPGSLNINYQDPLFQQNIGALDKTKIYMVYCKGGSRSAKASDIMAGLGFKTIYNMTGGFDAWFSAGYPSEK